MPNVYEYVWVMVSLWEAAASYLSEENGLFFLSPDGTRCSVLGLLALLFHS